MARTSPTPSPSRTELKSLGKVQDDLLELGDKAHKFLDAFERWSDGEEVSPFAYDRLRERALALKRELQRLGLP